MQKIFYDEAPYHVLYYDVELHAYRTDQFAGWMNQPPENGTPLFGYGPIGYTKLTLASEAARQRLGAGGQRRRPASGARRHAGPDRADPGERPGRQHAAAGRHPGARRGRRGRAGARAAAAQHDGHDEEDE